MGGLSLFFLPLVLRLIGEVLLFIFMLNISFTRVTLMPLFTLAPLKGELDFAEQKTEGSIFFTYISYFPLLVLRSCRLALSFVGCDKRKQKHALR